MQSLWHILKDQLILFKPQWLQRQHVCTAFFFVQPHVSYITNHSTDSRKCVYEVSGVGSPDLSNPAACWTCLAYWKQAFTHTGKWHHGRNTRQALSVSPWQSTGSRLRQNATASSWQKDHCSRGEGPEVCVYMRVSIQECVLHLGCWDTITHNAPFLSASKLLWLLKRMKGEWVIHPAWNFSTAHNKSSTTTDTV